MKKNYTAVVNMTKKFWHKNMTKFSQLLKQNVRNDASKYVNRINGLIEIALYLTSSKQSLSKMNINININELILFQICEKTFNPFSLRLTLYYASF